MLLKTIGEVHDFYFEFLSCFDKFAKDNDLRYFIHAGTLLGAVRHGDFISWDDDVDIVMFREDYEKLCSIPKENYPDNFRLVIPGENDQFYDFTTRCVSTVDTAIARNVGGALSDHVISPGIDIFILENSFTGLRHRIHTLMLLFVYALTRGHRIYPTPMPHRYAWMVRPIQWFGGHLPLRKLIGWYTTLSKRCKKQGVLYTSNNEPGSLKREYCSSWYSQSVPLSIRDKEFPAPAGYEFCLKEMFGEYMTLPPMEKRTPDHFEVLF